MYATPVSAKKNAIFGFHTFWVSNQIFNRVEFLQRRLSLPKIHWREVCTLIESVAGRTRHLQRRTGGLVESVLRLEVSV